MANETLGASFSIDVTNLKAGLAQANRVIRESESEFKAAAAGMDNWQESQEGLEARIKHLNTAQDVQKKKVEALEEQYKKAGYASDDMSAAAVQLRTNINKEKEALAKTEKELKQTKTALENVESSADDAGDALEEAGDSAKEAGDGFSVMKGAAASLVSGGITALVGAIGNAVTSFFGLAESTREARKSMAQLETSFQTAGLSAEDAENTFTELYSIMGDEGAATEAAQQLAKFSKDEADLAANTRILTGVMAEYGSSIPTEGLAEGMAATAAMGSVQGVLADALEWQGVNLDEYNAKLATMTSEEERAAYIQSTLTDLYGDSADAYRENNASIIESQKAQADLNSMLNEMGEIVEPMMTMLTQLATDLLSSIMPFVQLVGEGLTGALSGASGAADSLAGGLTGIVTTLLDKVVAMLPFIIDTIVAIVPQLLEKLLSMLPTILTTVIGMVIKIVEGLSAMLPTVIAAIMEVLPKLINSLVAAVPQILQAAVTLLMAIVQAIPVIIVELVNALPSIIQTIITAVVDSIPILIDAAISLLMAIVEAIPTIINALIVNLPKIIDTIITGVVSAVPQLLQGAIKLFDALITAIPQILPELIAAIPQIIVSIIGALIKGIPQLIKAGADLLAGLFTGLLNPKKIAEAVKSLFNGILGGLKKLFGIHSPSRVMADVIGKNLALGIGEGFDDNITGVNARIAGAMNFDSIGGVGTVGSRGNGVVVYQTNNYAQAHSRVELYKTKQETAAAVRLAMAGA